MRRFGRRVGPSSPPSGVTYAELRRPALAGKPLRPTGDRRLTRLSPWLLPPAVSPGGRLEVGRVAGPTSKSARQKLQWRPSWRRLARLRRRPASRLVAVLSPLRVGAAHLVRTRPSRAFGEFLRRTRLSAPRLVVKDARRACRPRRRHDPDLLLASGSQGGPPCLSAGRREVRGPPPHIADVESVLALRVPAAPVKAVR